MTDSILYTHWAYFDDESAAKACEAAMTTRFGCLASVEPSDGEWLLRASRSVVLAELTERHEEARAVVEAHGGDYDGGESG